MKGGKQGWFGKGGDQGKGKGGWQGRAPMDIGYYQEAPYEGEWDYDWTSPDWTNPGAQTGYQYEIGGLDICALQRIEEEEVLCEECACHPKDEEKTKQENRWMTAISRKNRRKEGKRLETSKAAAEEAMKVKIQKKEDEKSQERAQKDQKSSNSGELMHVGAQEEKRVSITIDSGASETVANQETFAEYQLQSSPGSRAGVKYNTAGQGQKPLENLGQIKAGLWTEDGQPRSMLFQIADVKKPLGSVSRICAMGHRVVMDDEGSYIEHKESGNRTWLRQEGGVYLLDTWIMDPAEAMRIIGPGFQRPGK